MSEAKTTTRQSKTRAPIVAKLTLPATRLRDMVNGVLPATSSSDVTPILYAAQFIVEKGFLRITSTDRYRVHTVIESEQIKTSGHGGTFIVPRASLVWLSKNANYFGRTAELRRMFDPSIEAEFRARPGEAGSVTFRVRPNGDGDEFELSLTEALMKGTFPPVVRFFETAQEAEEGAPTRVRLDYLAQAQRLASSVHEIPRIKFCAPDSTGKPAPALIQFSSPDRMGGTPYAEALIQPVREIHP